MIIRISVSRNLEEKEYSTEIIKKKLFSKKMKTKVKKWKEFFHTFYIDVLMPNGSTEKYEYYKFTCNEREQYSLKYGKQDYNSAVWAKSNDQERQDKIYFVINEMGKKGYRVDNKYIMLFIGRKIDSLMMSKKD